MVIDVLNMDEQMIHHKKNYEGVTQQTVQGYAVVLRDYVNLNVVQRLATPEAQALLNIVDPYEYRERLTMPKYLINGTGDEFFVPDSGQFYLSDLLGPTYVRYVPNVGHSLNNDAQLGAMNFFAAIDAGSVLPTFNWTVEGDGEVIRVNTVENPAQVRMWQATNLASLDFRQPTFGPKWTSSVLTSQGAGQYVGQVSPPASGGTAFFVELTYDVDGRTLTFTTEISIVTPAAGLSSAQALTAVDSQSIDEGLSASGIAHPIDSNRLTNSGIPVNTNPPANIFARAIAAVNAASYRNSSQTTLIGLGYTLQMSNAFRRAMTTVTAANDASGRRWEATVSPGSSNSILAAIVIDSGSQIFGLQESFDSLVPAAELETDLVVTVLPAGLTTISVSNSS